MFTRKVHIASKTDPYAVYKLRSPGFGCSFKSLGTIYTRVSDNRSRTSDINLPISNPGLPAFYLPREQALDPQSVIRENIEEVKLSTPGIPLSLPMSKIEEKKPTKSEVKEAKEEEKIEKEEIENGKKIAIKSVRLGGQNMHGAGSSGGKVENSEAGNSNSEDDEPAAEPVRKKSRYDFTID
jgi:hypothetical protein